MNDGKPGSERVRTHDHALKRGVEMLDLAGLLERVALVHTLASQDMLAELRSMVAHLGSQGVIPSVNIIPAMGAHTGPCAVGFAAVQAFNHEVNQGV